MPGFNIAVVKEVNDFFSSILHRPCVFKKFGATGLIWMPIANFVGDPQKIRRGLAQKLQEKEGGTITFKSKRTEDGTVLLGLRKDSYAWAISISYPSRGLDVRTDVTIYFGPRDAILNYAI